MENLLYNIIRRIADAMPDVSTVDEDYGQLEAIDRQEVDTYPLTFPAVLVSETETDWSNLGDLVQKGRAQVAVRLAIDCYDDTHYDSGTMEAIMSRADMADRIHKALQGFRPLGDGPLIRERSRFYTWSHGIKVYEQHYTLTVSQTVRERAVAEPPHTLSLAVSVSARQNESQ